MNAITIPDVYESLLQFLVGSTLQFEAPTREPWMIYLAEATTDTNNLVVITLNRYSSYQNYLNGNVFERLGTNFGFIEAKLELTKGIPTIGGSLYSVQYGVYSGAAFNLDLVVHGLIGGAEEM